MKKAVVTGAFGFIGRHVARVAEREGYFVTGMGHGNWGRGECKNWGIQEWRSCDITIETLSTYAGTPDILIHCAGSGSVGFSISNPFQDFQRTVLGTLAVLEYMRLSSYETQLVLPSSAGVYGATDTMPIHTHSPLTPCSPYGMHKKMAEELCQTYGRHFGLNVAVVRLFSVYGIGLRKQLLWDTCQKICLGEFSFFGTGLETRDWIHVEDAAKLLLNAVKRAVPNCPIINGGTGTSVTIRDIVQKLIACYGTDIDPTFNGQERVGDPKHYQADITEALSWDWKPEYLLENELTNYVRWFKSGAA